VYRAAQRGGKGWCTAWCTGLSDRELAAIFDETEQEKPLAAVLAEHGVNQHRKGKDLIISSPPSGQGGTSREHLLARLRRDDPDAAARVERGELSALKTARGPGVRLSRSA
jgi:hypothetical protein